MAERGAREDKMRHDIDKLSKWIISNLETVNSLGLQGVIPVTIDDNYITFQKVGYRVVYSYDIDTGTLVRVDNIHEPV